MPNGSIDTHSDSIKQEPLSKINAPRGYRAKFIEGALKHNSDECYVFPYKTGTGGYARVKIDGIAKPLHRHILSLATGFNPESHVHALHDPIHCSDRACANPRHLRWGSNHENIEDRKLSGTAISDSQREILTLMYARYASVAEIKAALKRFGFSSLYKIEWSRELRITNLCKFDPSYRLRFAGAPLGEIKSIEAEILRERRVLFSAICNSAAARNDKIKMLAKNGYSQPEIAKPFGLASVTISKIVNDAYIPLSMRGANQ